MKNFKNYLKEAEEQDSWTLFSNFINGEKLYNISVAGVADLKKLSLDQKTDKSIYFKHKEPVNDCKISLMRVNFETAKIETDENGKRVTIADYGINNIQVIVREI